MTCFLPVSYLSPSLLLLFFLSLPLSSASFHLPFFITAVYLFDSFLPHIFLLSFLFQAKCCFLSYFPSSLFLRLISQPLRSQIFVRILLLSPLLLLMLSSLSLFPSLDNQLGVAPTEMETHFIHILAPIAQWLGASNSCINPILYAFFNDKFRAGFKVSGEGELAVLSLPLVLLLSLFHCVSSPLYWYSYIKAFPCFTYLCCYCFGFPSEAWGWSYCLCSADFLSLLCWQTDMLPLCSLYCCLLFLWRSFIMPFFQWWSPFCAPWFSSDFRNFMYFHLMFCFFFFYFFVVIPSDIPAYEPSWPFSYTSLVILSATLYFFHRPWWKMILR